MFEQHQTTSRRLTAGGGSISNRQMAHFPSGACNPRSRRRLPPVRVSSARSQLQPSRARSDARTSTAVRYPPDGVGVSVLRVGSRARARCATAVRRVTGRSGGRRSSRDEGDAGRGRGVSGYHLAGGRRSQAASRASFLRVPARWAARHPQNRQNRGFHPRSRRRLPPVRVSSARSQLQPCRARSDARTSTAVRYPLRRHAAARPARILPGVCCTAWIRSTHARYQTTIADRCLSPNDDRPQSPNERSGLTQYSPGSTT